MFTQKAVADYDKIMLSFKERLVLRRILKRGEVPACSCTPKQLAIFEQNGLIIVDRNHEAPMAYGVRGIVQGEPKTMYATDKAFRYFLYRKEDYFKGKLPVVISFTALIISIISLALQLLS